MTYLYKNRGVWEILERIRALYTNTDGHSDIRVAFIELHSEKKESYYSDQKFRIYNFHIFIVQESCSIYTRFFKTSNKTC